MAARKTYVVLDTLNPGLRTIASIFLVALGYGFQLAIRNILVGLPFIIACLILNLIKNVTVKRVQAKKYTWQEVTLTKIDEVIEQCNKVKKFSSSNVGCVIGIFIIIFFIAIFFVPLLHILTNIGFPISATIIDALILFGGLAFSGRRNAWMPHALDIKAKVVKRLSTTKVISSDPVLQAIPYLEIGEGVEGAFPRDTRFMVRFKEVPKEFIGLQGQISINSVKGHAYPYFYVVVIARPGFKLFEKIPKATIDKCVIERKKTSEVDVIVIRQKTTKTSGYHTDERVQDHILSQAIRLVKSVL